MRRLLLPVLACVLAFAPVPHDAVERLYASGIYPRLQPLVTRMSNLVPFAWLDPLVALTIAAVLAAGVRAWRRAPGRRAARMAATILSVAQLASAIYLVFLSIWGFNYRRAPAAERLAVAPARVTPERLAQLATLAVARVDALYDPARQDARLTGDSLLVTLAPAFARAEAVVGSNWHITPGRPKASLIARTFPLSGVDGMINPFALEVVLNPEVLPFERPFVLAHEWAHLAGHAPESEASFVAFAACVHGARDAQYSGWLDLLIHVLGNRPAAERQELLALLGDGPRADLRAIGARLRRVQPAVRQVSWSMYDQYLRANRVAAGVADYDEVVTLVAGSRLLADVIDR